MPEQNSRVLAEPKPLGVIDTLTAGFELVRKRPATLFVPILLDAAIWFLPRLALGPLFRPAVDQLFNPAGAPPDVAASAQQMRDTANELFGSLNLLGVVSAALDSVARVPSLLAFDDGNVHSPITSLAFTISLPSASLALFLFIPLFLLALFVAAIYIEWLAQGVRPLVQDTRAAIALRVGALWLRLIGLSVFMLFLLVASGLVLGLTALFAPLGSDAGSFFGALALVGWFWLSIYFFFAVAALAVSQVGLLDALRRSVFILRVFFWASLLLIGLTFFLQRGLALIWSGLMVSPAGALVGIVANAFIGTSLLAASMIYYQDRMNTINRLIARARANAGTLRR